MKLSLVILGIFIAVGLLGGAYILASSKTDNKEYEAKLKLADDRIDSLALRIDTFEGRISELDAKLEDYLLSIDVNNKNIQEMKDQLAAAGKNNANMRNDTSPAVSGSGLGVDKQEIIETLKDEVKREIKEENKIAQRKAKSAGVKKWADLQTEQLCKRMDTQFLQFAEKIKLDRNQEIAVKNITEGLIEKVSTIWSNWEERLAEDMADEDWGELKGELGQVYEDAKHQLLQHVSERQAGAIMDFIQSNGK